MTARELDEIITVRWPAVMRRVMADGSDEWLKGFVKSIARHGKRRGWRPTDKQEAVMRRLLAEHGSTSMHGLELIEE